MERLIRVWPATAWEQHLALLTLTHAIPSALPARLHRCSARRVRGSALWLFFLVWRLRPRLLVCSMAHANFLVLWMRPLLPRSTRILIRQNGAIGTVLRERSVPIWTRLAYRLLYRRADRVVCQSEAMATEVRRICGRPYPNTVVLPNPVPVSDLQRFMSDHAIAWPDRWPCLLAASRLAPEKGLDLLLDALVLLCKDYPRLLLRIAGDGPLRQSLALHAEQRGLAGHVEWLGPVDEPARYFAGTTLFVLSSRHEALPNAVLEAACCGLPLVLTPASQALSAMVHAAPGVWMAEQFNGQSLHLALRQALSTMAENQRFTHSFVQRFALPGALREWVSLFEAVAH